MRISLSRSVNGMHPRCEDFRNRLDPGDFVGFRSDFFSAFTVIGSSASSSTTPPSSNPLSPTSALYQKAGSLFLLAKWSIQRALQLWYECDG